MKSKATKSQAAQAAFNLPNKAPKQFPGTRNSKPAQPASSLKNEYALDRSARGRSPTVRALVWQNGLTQVAPMPPTTAEKKSPQVQHVEFALPAHVARQARPQNQ